MLLMSITFGVANLEVAKLLAVKFNSEFDPQTILEQGELAIGIAVENTDPIDIYSTIKSLTDQGLTVSFKKAESGEM